MLTYKRGIGWVETPEETITIMGVTYRCEDRKPEPDEIGCWQWSKERQLYYKSHTIWLQFLASNFHYIKQGTTTWLVQSNELTADEQQQQEWVTFVPC